MNEIMDLSGAWPIIKVLLIGLAVSIGGVIFNIFVEDLEFHYKESKFVKWLVVFSYILIMATVVFAGYTLYKPTEIMSSRDELVQELHVEINKTDTAIVNVQEVNDIILADESLCPQSKDASCAYIDFLSSEGENIKMFIPEGSSKLLKLEKGDSISYIELSEKERKAFNTYLGLENVVLARGILTNKKLAGPYVTEEFSFDSNNWLMGVKISEVR